MLSGQLSQTRVVSLSLQGFVTCLGERNVRMQLCLEKRLAPVVHAAISTLLGLIMLVGAEFDFIVK